jgi:hypothetical protein
MSSRMLFVALAPLLLAACGLTREVVDSRGGPASAEVIKSIQGRSVTVNLWDSSAYEGKAVECGPDTLALIVDRHGARENVPLNKLKMVRLVGNRSTYILGGVLVGGGVGAAIGYEAGKPGPPQQAQQGMFTMRLDASGPGAVIGGLVGALGGALIGSAVTPRKEFVFPGNRPAHLPANELATIEVNSLIEETDSYVMFRWIDRNVTLATGEIAIRRVGNLIRITGPKDLFREAGIAID